MRLFRRDVRNVRVSGVVVDEQTDEPIAQARIIMMVSGASIKSPDFCYGLTTDERGVFLAEFDSEVALRNRIVIFAKSPDELYGEWGGTGKATVNGSSLVVENVVLQLGELEGRRRSEFKYRYASFCASCPNCRRIKFLDGGWTALNAEGEVP